MAESPKRDLEARLADGPAIDAAIRRAVREAVRRHKLLGNPIAVWRDNQVCWLQPEEIEIPEESQRTQLQTTDDTDEHG